MYSQCENCNYFMTSKKVKTYIITKASTNSPTFSYREWYSKPFCIKLKSTLYKSIENKKPKRRKNNAKIYDNRKNWKRTRNQNYRIK